MSKKLIKLIWDFPNQDITEVKEMNNIPDKKADILISQNERLKMPMYVGKMTPALTAKVRTEPLPTRQPHPATELYKKDAKDKARAILEEVLEEKAEKAESAESAEA